MPQVRHIRNPADPVEVERLEREIEKAKAANEAHYAHLRKAFDHAWDHGLSLGERTSEERTKAYEAWSVGIPQVRG